MKSVKYSAPELAIIGGSGFYEMSDLQGVQEIRVETPYSDVLGIQVGQIGAKKVAFLARHGSDHRLPPHKVNYRSNIWALHKMGVKNIIALNAVGGISAGMKPGALVVPDQIIDYTYGREHSFADLLSDQVNHIDFTYPFTEDVRCKLIGALESLGLESLSKAVYACTQGPRLETAAEVKRLERDGCDVVGMTAMPEAALARELGLNYAMLCTVVNWGAGISEELITLSQIHAILEQVNPLIRRALVAYLEK